jgi:hypothetical protein
MFLSERPHGGFGVSVYGKDLSIYALEEYTRRSRISCCRPIQNPDPGL